MNPNDGDVLTVLGVLHNLTRDYDKAEECFRAALQLDPKNYSLWNKLGATEANSHKQHGSKQAVHAYRSALELKPNYVRAWVNMGIGYANQGAYQNAAKYYLKALSMNSKADHVWSYLKLCLSYSPVYSSRVDLQQSVENKDIDAFRGEFKF